MEILKFNYAHAKDGEKKTAYTVQFNINNYPEYSINLDHFIHRANQDVKHNIFGIYILIKILRLGPDMNSGATKYIIKEEYDVISGKPVLRHKQPESNNNIKSIW